MTDPNGGADTPGQNPLTPPTDTPPAAPPPSAPPPPPYGAAPPPPAGGWGQQQQQQGAWGQQPQTAWGQPDPYRPYPQAAAVNPYESRGTTVLVLGILGLVLCGLIGIAAWVQGNGVRDEAKAAGYAEPSNNQIGRILGMVSTGLMAAGVLFMIVWFVFVIALAGSSSGY